MKTIKAVATLVVTLGLMFTATTVTASEKKAPVTLTPVDQLKWTDVPNAPAGVQVSVVEGDAAKGAHHFFLKFPAGFEAPLHHHSADHYGVVVKGTVDLTVDGKETKLPAGSYFAFTQKTKHSTKCEAGSECVMLIDSRKPWDVVMPDAKSAKK